MIPKFTSTLLVMAITTTNAMWVPDSEYRLDKRAVDEPATKTTEAHTTTKKDTAPTFKNSEEAKTTTTKKTASASKSASSSKSAETHSSSSSIAASSSAAPTSVIATLPTSTGGLTSSISTPTSSSTPAPSSGGSSSAGMIGGIVAAVAVAVVGVSAFMVIRKRKARQAMRAANLKPDPFTQGFGSDDPKPYNNNFPPQTNNTYQNQTSTFDNYEVAAISHGNNEVIQQQQHQPQQYQPQTAPVAVASAPIVAAAAATTPIAAQFQPPSLGLFTVIATYIPTLSDELEIETGDQIELIVEYDDGWCQGVNISKGHTKGVFPRHCIDYATAPSNHTSNVDVERSKRVSSMYKP